jgi:hypothetical protein
LLTFCSQTRLIVPGWYYLAFCSWNDMITFKKFKWNISLNKSPKVASSQNQ